MLRLTQRLGQDELMNNKQAHRIEISDTLTLPYELRIRGRLKACTDGGRDVGLFLDRGPVLRHHDLLQADSGEVIQVLAADEPVATAYIDNGLPLARLAYHLGNRHVSLAIGCDNNNKGDQDNRAWVRFPPDHVLEELARLLGATVVHHDAPFDPESGAYAHAGREHVQSHGYSHSHDDTPHSHDNHSHNHSHSHHTHDHPHHPTHPHVHDGSHNHDTSHLHDHSHDHLHDKATPKHGS